jgi:large subunit ribosomal protein L4
MLLNKRMKVSLYNTKGASAGTAELRDSVFGLPWNADLVHQVLVAYQANERDGNAHTKNRSEVSGGGKKPWKQKGTGRARHGSTRSPIWVHGGVAHGPRNEKDYSQKINHKMRLKALGTLLSAKMSDNTVLSLGDALEISKTKDGEQLFTTLATKVPGFETIYTKTNKNNILVVTSESTSDATIRSLRNLPCVSVISATRLNPIQVARSRYVVLADATSVDTLLGSRLAIISKKSA